SRLWALGFGLSGVKCSPFRGNRRESTAQRRKASQKPALMAGSKGAEVETPRPSKPFHGTKPARSPESRPDNRGNRGGICNPDDTAVAPACRSSVLRVARRQCASLSAERSPARLGGVGSGGLR